MSRFRLTVLLVSFVLLILSPLILYADDLVNALKGRFYISDYYSQDSGSYDFHSLISRLSLFLPDKKESAVSFKLDARVKAEIKDNEISDKSPDHDISELWLSYRFPGKKYQIIAGRQYIYEMFNTSVDGLNMKYAFGNGWGAGVFGGLAPDKYDNSFTRDFASLGAYGFYESARYRLQMGYERLLYKGSTDREYVSFKLFSHPAEKVRFNLISAASLNQETNRPEMENLSMNLIYAYSRQLRLNFYYNYFRAIKYFESSKKFIESADLRKDYFLDTNSQTRIGLRTDYKIQKDFIVYASAAYQMRKIDHEDALRLGAGFRKYDLYGFDLTGRYTHINNFTSTSDEFYFDISRNFFNKVDLTLYASHEQEELDIENGYTTGLRTYGLSLYWQITAYYYLSMYLEHYDEEDYYNSSVYAQLGYRF